MSFNRESPLLVGDPYDRSMGGVAGTSAPETNASVDRPTNRGRDVNQRHDPPTLTELANHFKSDKGTQTGGPPHRYTYLYDLLFSPYRENPINFLEIGLAVGGPEVGGSPERAAISPSVQMWLAYFSSAHIFGFDISDFSHQKDPRFTFVRGDLSSEKDIKVLANAARSFDIIIDDASHASYHQQLALKLLFPKMVAGGLYIIEDLQWQPEAYEHELPPVPKTARFLRRFFESEEYIDNDLLTVADMQSLKKNICSFSYFGSFDGTASPTKLIVMRKRVDAQSNVTNEPAFSRAAPTGAAREFITAAYNAILERRPGPGGLLSYEKQFVGRLASEAVESITRSLLNSQEFRVKQASRELEVAAKAEEASIMRAQEAHLKGKMDVLFIQTADQSKYRALLEISSRTVSEYCARHGFKYDMFLGLIRGYRNWQATFNRILIIRNLVESGYFGWICYLDADAFIADLDFDLRAYLADKSDIAMIAADGAKPDLWWDVNAGVFLLNLGHATARAIARQWFIRFTEISDSELRSLEDWPKGGPDDQSLLHRVLNEVPGVQRHLIVQRSAPRLLNYPSGLFIRQILRTHGNFDERLAILDEEVGRILPSHSAKTGTRNAALDQDEHGLKAHWSSSL